ncbi:TPA: hypothetical protein KDX48_002318 [Vibrio parahaemolyticus]|nr:hypothetical protein [Vibrio parahaemolyticus]
MKIKKGKINRVGIDSFNSYYERNKSSCKSKQAAYYESNKEKILIKAKENREAKKTFEQLMKELSGPFIEKQALYLTGISKAKGLDYKTITKLWEFKMKNIPINRRLDITNILEFEKYIDE